MPGIDILKDWEQLKKQGLTGLIVALIWGATELKSAFEPKDKSCTEEVIYLQAELKLDNAYIRDLKITNQMLTEKSKTDSISFKTDSVYRNKVKPLLPK